MPLYEIAPWLCGAETSVLARRSAAAKDVAELERWLQRWPAAPNDPRGDPRRHEADFAEAEQEPADAEA